MKGGRKMEITRNFKKFRAGGRAVMLLLLGLMLSALSYGNAQAEITDYVRVLDGSITNPPTSISVGYRWLVEADVTYDVTPNVPGTNWATKFHKSYMPVVAKGCVNPPANAVCKEVPFTPVNGTRYYVSVVPFEGYSMGGGQLVGNGTATVYVQPLPIPTAQITIFAFIDDNPINNAPDLPGEIGLPGVKVTLEDAGGRYGVSAGQAFQNAFGHPLGTTYKPNCDPYTGGDACIDVLGQGFVITDADGMAVFKNLAPGKYGAISIPPAGQGWQQTTTIEGTKLIDAWVKANEPPFFAEFGPPGWHVFVGFTKEYNKIPAPTGGVAATISGQVVNNHLSRPPGTAFYDGAPPPHTTPWVGLNANAGIGPALYVSRTDDGAFTIPNVPPGDYQLAVFDDNLDLIFNFLGVTVNADGSCSTPDGECDLETVPTFDWFTKIWGFVFNDQNENGYWDKNNPDEYGIPNVPVNLRWRDGSLYQSFPTDGEGYAPFDEVFPFFSWLVAEVDFARLKATGLTVVPDAGGLIDPDDEWTFGGQLNPQLQPENDNLPYRTETGPVLTQAFQGFLGQTSVIAFGKTAYGSGENGGISGIVYYSVTRAEDDPEFGFPEPWEPGIPGVTVNLYEVTGLNPDGTPIVGNLVNTTKTDSWDDSLPTNCPGDNNAGNPIPDVEPNDCFDGMRNWNQVRPGIFDGGYAFTEYYPGGITVDGLGNITPIILNEEPSPIISGRRYVVEVMSPSGYEIVKSQDKNVDFGDEYVPSPELTPPKCVGADYVVPDSLSLFPNVDAPLAGDTLKTCDRKLVEMRAGSNLAADFYLFTEVPISAHIKGFILDDTANEFDPNSPQFGEKYAPPWLPVGIYDWAGRLVGETISDQWGVYNTLVPSTYTQNLPMPSGTSPNMLTTCMNDPNSPTYGDNFNPQYSTFCYTFQYMPGTTTYLDTPVVPVAAFAGPDQFPLDCELPYGTPKIYSVSVPNNGVDGGPYMTRTATGAGRQVVIQSVGTVPVPNPNYEGPGGLNPKTIDRDYGFGDVQGTGTVQLVAANGTVYPLTVGTWTDSSITATVPGTVPTQNNNATYYQLPAGGKP